LNRTLERGMGSGDPNWANSPRFFGIGAIDDDGVTPLPTSYNRLKEGVERFFITDINNPAASSVAQSTLPVMWDSWTAADGRPIHWGDQSGATVQFNHVPGGSNVLYMDGHVEFVRLNSKFPMLGNLQSPSLGSFELYLSVLYSGCG
jgi:prepilin-type processing-associated H-X9-DG protein